MNMHQIVTRFNVGEVWRDDTTKVPQRIVAITGDEDRPIITQDEDGEVYAYSRTGRYHSGNGKYDLTTLVSGHALETK